MKPSSGGSCSPWAGHAKKTVRVCEQDPLERAAWRWQAALLRHPPDLVFVDESGANRALRPRYSHASGGARCHGQAPRNCGRNTSTFAAMDPAGSPVTMNVEGSTNKEVCLTYLERVLCSALRPGRTVILDNLAVHKNEAVKCADRGSGLPAVVFARLQPGLKPD